MKKKPERRQAKAARPAIMAPLAPAALTTGVEETVGIVRTRAPVPTEDPIGALRWPIRVVTAPRLRPHSKASLSAAFC